MTLFEFANEVHRSLVFLPSKSYILEHIKFHKKAKNCVSSYVLLFLHYVYILVKNSISILTNTFVVVRYFGKIEQTEYVLKFLFHTNISLSTTYVENVPRMVGRFRGVSYVKKPAKIV